MEELSDPVTLLAGAEIHGFETTADLDVQKLMNDATMRWLRPNEVHAILSNYMLFRIQPQPVDNPPSGTVLLFDRKMLRNFRKDGHNWRKKKDGKTVQEAHEKLKIGNEERIHVYYARNEEDPYFYRRCYWLLDRDLERIVLVHYRRTSKISPIPREPKEASRAMSSPITPSDSGYGSQSQLSGSALVSAEDSVKHYSNDCSSRSPTTQMPEMGTYTPVLDLLEKLDWSDLIDQPVRIDSSPASSGNVIARQHDRRCWSNGSKSGEGQGHKIMDFSSSKKQNRLPFQQVVVSAKRREQEINQQMSVHASEESGSYNDCIFQSQSGASLQSADVCSYGILDPSKPSPVSAQKESSTVQGSGYTCFTCPAFTIMDISPTWAYVGEETKVIVIGSFHESCKKLSSSNIMCVFGSTCIPAEQVQIGVYRVMALFQEPGSVGFYITMDGQTPISQPMKFEFRPCASSLIDSSVTSSIVSSMAEFQELAILKRLAYLLFSTADPLSSLNLMGPNSLKEAKRFVSLSSSLLENNWVNYLGRNSGSSTLLELLELVLKNKLQEWIVLKAIEGCKVMPRDKCGQGAIHLCAMLDYAWAVHLFSVSGFSLDFRDTHGWTAMHWAAHYGRERTIAALLSARANPSLVTDPTPDVPGGCTAADLASAQGFEGLGAYLAEKGLQAHYNAMTNSGNASCPERHASSDSIVLSFETSEKLSEQELCLKDSLAAYRHAADAADRIQAAFRERSHKQQIKAAQLEKAEDKAAALVAALKIQKAYRNYNRRRMMKAAARIQGVFRTWKARRNFLNLRHQVIKIQAIYRGHQTRKQYHKICWSVGVLEKAVLRWRLKRKGLRGLQVEMDKDTNMEEDNCVEEEFYRVSREQAEERIQRSVVRVQAMFRSYQAQQEYRRMKLAYYQAKLEYNFVDLGEES